MPALRIDGKTLSAELKEKLKVRVLALKKRGITPGLAVILVGEDEASKIYVRNKEKGCDEIGVKSFSYRLPATASQEELEELIKKLNADESVNGILVQLPLPKGLDEQKALSLIDAKKDVDGFHIENMGKLLIGAEGVVACTPKGAMYMIRSTGIELSGKHAVVVGRSNIVGKPMSVLLLNANCTVTTCHSRTKNLADFTKTADILVAAVGKPKFITADMVKEGAVVIDVGINRVDGKVVGDVDYDAVSEVAGYITPVPGGVGKMTIAMLLDNTVEAAERYA